jgi:hypothetical protein
LLFQSGPDSSIFRFYLAALASVHILPAWHPELRNGKCPEGAKICIAVLWFVTKSSMRLCVRLNEARLTGDPKTAPIAESFFSRAIHYVARVVIMVWQCH